MKSLFFRLCKYLKDEWLTLMPRPTRSETIGGVLMLVLLLAVAISWLLFSPIPSVDSAAIPLDTAQIDSLCESAAYPVSASTEKQVSRPHPFDPNHADSLSLVEVGLRPWQARSLVRYREAVYRKNGRRAVFRRTEDLLQLDWMVDTLYRRIAPWVEIHLTAEDTVYHVDSAQLLLRQHYRDSVRAKREADSLRRDSIQAARLALRPVKKDTLLDLNHCDTTELMYLRHIAAYSARRIVRHRAELGGYASVEQLRYPELRLKHLPVDSIAPYLTVNADEVKKLNINVLTVDALMRHPYISFEMAREMKHATDAHRIRSESDLLRYYRLDQSPLLRVLPYLSY